jgi:hypothetical protein
MKKQKLKSKPSLRITDRIRDHFIQAVLIFASVFLAFALNEYRMSRVEKRQTREAIDALIAEMEQNKAILETYLPYHEEMMLSTERLLTKDSLQHMQYFEPATLVREYKGIMRDILTNQAWRYLNDQNIKLDIKTRIDITFAYQQQQFVTNSLDKVVGLLSSREIIQEDKLKENAFLFYLYIGDLWGQEEAMIDTYEYTLSKLKTIR